jgi:hypothetical protein
MNTIYCQTVDIQKVASFILENRYTIFGGYVRDLLAGKKPNDIDVLLSRPTEAYCLLDLLVKEYERVTIVYNPVERRSNRYNADVLRLEVEGVCIDLVSPVNVAANGVIHRPDASVNRLKMTSDSISLMGFAMNYTIQDIINQIVLRVYVPEAGMSGDRISKMESAGWRHLLV